ncbi:cytochrome P450 2H2-like isoform X1 [Dermacentor andersoni]|uniref:cytochrome P450 2H2-like isoform X1 n=2 Tax=Dermacentor andersoni TaxID=34620 RepID=UPI003B3B00C3
MRGAASKSINMPLMPIDEYPLQIVPFWDPKLPYVAALTSLAATLLMTLFWFRHKTRDRNLPPGPRSWLFMGSFSLATGRIPFDKAMKWAKKYGPIVGLRQGSVHVVMISDYEQIKKLFSMPQLQYRPTTWGQSSKEKGLTALNGEAWKQNREFSMRTLTKLGFGTEVMHKYIQEEACHLADFLACQHGCPVASFSVTHKSHINSMCRFLLGYRFDFEDPRFVPICKALSGFRLQSAAAPVEHRAAWLRRAIIDRLWPSSVSASRHRLLKTLNVAVRDLIAHNGDTKSDGRQKSYIDLYMDKIWQAEQNNNPYFTVEYLAGNMCDIVMGSATSTNVYLHWNLLNLASRADNLQADLQREIDTVVGRSRSPCWEDHKCLPLTMATLWEMYRWKVATPFNLPRGVGENMKFENYDLPKDTVVFPNLLAIHRNTKLWKDPDTFDPSRFLRADGKTQTTRPGGLLTFSVGKRMCPGESMAMVQIFLFMTTLLHRFHILPVEGEKYDISPFGPSLELLDTKLRFVVRH